MEYRSLWNRYASKAVMQSIYHYDDLPKPERHRIQLELAELEAELNRMCLTGIQFENQAKKAL